MKDRFSTEQEEFWAGQFGDEYTIRNDGAAEIASNIALFAKILAHTRSVRSVLELGANRGLNMRALRPILPDAALTALEINAQAAKRLRSIDSLNVVESSMLDWQPSQQYDFVFTKGVLIHIAPERLHDVYALMARASSRYIMVAEYYAPVPAEVPYRGHSGKLFKRDFAGEMLDLHPGMRVIEHGFAWRRDVFPQDDLNWFLMEKTGN